LEPEDITLVLVHDAWLGAWAWEGVLAHLQEREWSALALDLPEIRQGSTPSMESYARALSQLVGKVTTPAYMLVGHGTGGALIQFAYEKHLAEDNHLAGLIFAAAVVLNNGESVLDVLPPEMSDYFRQLASLNSNNAIDIAQIPDYWQFNLVNDDQPNAAGLMARLIPEPLAPLEEKLALTEFYSRKPPCAYLSFNEDMSLPPGELYPRMANRLGSYRFFTVNAGHEAPVTKPRETAEALIFLASTMQPKS
jgi:pimeloyl-ACP methyl ester carboxylesterase